MMSLSNLDKKRFRTIGHDLKPIVIIAQKGLTENIRQEIDRALESHELIKLKIQIPDRQAKQALVAEITAQAKAEVVQQVGHVVLLYRAAKRPDPKLSNLLRKTR